MPVRIRPPGSRTNEGPPQGGPSGTSKSDRLSANIVPLGVCSQHSGSRPASPRTALRHHSADGVRTLETPRVADRGASLCGDSHDPGLSYSVDACRHPSHGSAGSPERKPTSYYALLSPKFHRACALKTFLPTGRQEEQQLRGATLRVPADRVSGSNAYLTYEFLRGGVVLGKATGDLYIKV